MLNDVATRNSAGRERFGRELPSFLKSNLPTAEESTEILPNWALPEVDTRKDLRARIAWSMLLNPRYFVMSLVNFGSSWLASRSLFRLGFGVPAFVAGVSILAFLGFSLSAVGRDQNRNRILNALENARTNEDHRAQEILLTSLLHEQPDNRDSQFEMARLRDNESAMHALASEGHNPARLWLVQHHLDQSEPNQAEAERLLQEILKTDAINEHANLELGRLYVRQNQFDIAHSYLRAAAESDPAWYLDVARCAAHQENPLEAARAARRAENALRRRVEQAPRDADRRIALAESLCLAGQLRSAKTVLDKGLRLESDNPRLLSARDRVTKQLDGQLASDNPLTSSRILSN